MIPITYEDIYLKLKIRDPFNFVLEKDITCFLYSMYFFLKNNYDYEKKNYIDVHFTDVIFVKNCSSIFNILKEEFEEDFKNDYDQTVKVFFNYFVRKIYLFFSNHCIFVDRVFVCQTHDESSKHRIESIFSYSPPTIESILKTGPKYFKLESTTVVNPFPNK